MSASGRRTNPALTHAPIFFSFFTWGFGTGAQNLGRPLFAFAVTGNVFLVGVMLAANAVPRAFTGPITGFLTDKLGRKPMVLMGPIVRGITNVGQYFADDYLTFFVLEMIGQVGVAIWATSSNVLLSGRDDNGEPRPRAGPAHHGDAAGFRCGTRGGRRAGGDVRGWSRSSC